MKPDPALALVMVSVIVLKPSARTTQRLESSLPRTGPGNVQLHLLRCSAELEEETAE